MRAEAGFVAAHLLLAATGATLLYALGLVQARPRSLLAAAGPAYLSGVALVIPTFILLLVIGAPFRTPVLVLVCLVEAAVLAVLGRRGTLAAGPPLRPLLRNQLERVVLIVAAAGLAVWGLWVARAFAHLPTQLDDARIWSLKSFTLFYVDHLEPHVFDSAPYVASHLDYPILEPTLLASIYRLMGSPGSVADHLALWIVVLAFAWTAGWLLARRLQGVVWLVPLAALVVAPALYTNVKLGYSDAFYACFLALGALLVGDWIEERRPASLALAALMLGAAANAKNEGTAGALVILACAGAVAASGRDRRAGIRVWLLASLAVVAMAAPWRVWVAAHGIQNSDQPSVGRAISPGYLSDQIGRVGPAVTDALQQALSAWPVFLAGLIAVAIVHLVARRRARLAAYYLAATFLLGFTIVFAYWTSTQDIRFHLDTSIDRTVIGTLMVAAIGVAHLVGRERDDSVSGAASSAPPSASPPW